LSRFGEKYGRESAPGVKCGIEAVFSLLGIARNPTHFEFLRVFWAATKAMTADHAVTNDKL